MKRSVLTILGAGVVAALLTSMIDTTDGKVLLLCALGLFDFALLPLMLRRLTREKERLEAERQLRREEMERTMLASLIAQGVDIRYVTFHWHDGSGVPSYRIDTNDGGFFTP